MRDHPRLEEVFHTARAIDDADDRRAFLDTACKGDPVLRAEVEEMLASDADAGAFLDSSAEPRRFPATIEAAGDVIGRYELLEHIGEGGFGAVFMAQQTRPGSPRVALKIVKPGMDTRRVLARFETERRALARMDHPGIARVFDAGATTGGRPYFVMELVHGAPITTFADEHGLDVPERLELLRDVCAAVQHAHQKGVIHRDLKPSNVLVAMVDGRPLVKVIDFGIAKATSTEDDDRSIVTADGLFIGTPQYMSPEQAGLADTDVDTRADVFSLGVLMYELLTGTTPLDPDRLRGAGVAEVQRLVDEAATPRPSTRLVGLETAAAVAARRQVDVRALRRLLERDLDWIVLKAMERDRTRRYATVRDLAEDIRRALAEEPVQARPPSARYRLRKFARRNRAAVTATAAVAAVLVAGVAATSAALVWALATKADLATANAALDRTVGFQDARLGEIDPMKVGLDIRAGLLARATPDDAASLETLLAGAEFTTLAREVLAQNILDPTQTAIDRELADEPGLQAALLLSHATVLIELGLLDRAESPTTRAIETRRTLLGAEHPDTLAAVATRATLLRKRGRFEEALGLYTEVLETRRRELGDDDLLTATACNGMGTILNELDRHDESAQHFRSAIATLTRHHGADHEETLRAVSNLGTTHQRAGRFDEAAACYRAVVDGLGPEVVIGAQAGSNLGGVLRLQGKLDEAEAALREARSNLLQLLGRDHLTTLSATNVLATILDGQGKTDEADRLLQETLDSRRRVLGPLHLHTLVSVANLGATSREAGRLERAERLGAESVRGAQTAYATHWLVGGFMVEYGRTLAALDRDHDAERTLLEGRELIVARKAPPDRIADANCALADFYESRERDEAREWRALCDG